jgi:hypothetical protein
MIETIIGFIFIVAAAEATVEATVEAYNYVEPKVIQGYEYVQEKLD